MRPEYAHTELMVAQRHVEEARRRLARQQALAESLAGRNHPLAPLAERVLEVLRRSLQVALNHADRLQREAKALQSPLGRP